MIILPAIRNTATPSSWLLTLQCLYDALRAPHDAVLVMQAWETYQKNVAIRKPQPGDLSNMDLLYKSIVSLHPNISNDIHTTASEWARNIAMRYYTQAIEAHDPISYSGTMDWFADANATLDALSRYDQYKVPSPQTFPLQPLAIRLQKIAQLETNFNDLKDTDFAEMFEQLTLKIGHLHINSQKSHP